MAKVTNAFTTYIAKGNREDLSDAIYNIDPSDTPFISLAGTRNVNAVTFDWQVESLPAVDASNKDVEGFELARAAGQATVRASNVCQISHRDATVSGTQQAVDHAGRKSEMAHQMALKGKALKRDMETILCSKQPLVTGDDTTARQTRALEHWLTTASYYGTDGADPASATAALTDGSYRAFTEVLLADAIQDAYTAGAEPDVLLMGPYAKRKFSGFAGRSQVKSDVDANTIVAAADFYLSDFGTMKALPSRWIRARTVFGIDPEYVAVAYLRKFLREDIAKVGDAETKMIVSEYGLEMKNEAAHFKIADVADSLANTP